MPTDYSKYPDNWKDEIRPAALKKAGYKCEKCKVRQRAYGYRTALKTFVECDGFLINWATANGRKIIRIHLAICHLDHDPTNCEPPNLMAMCQQCHNQYDAQHRALNRKIRRSSPS